MMLKRFVLASALLLSGCSKPEPVTPPEAAAPPIPAWQARADQLTALIAVGLTEAEVTRLAGESKRTKSLVTTGTAIVIWEYELGENRYFQVRFDQNNRVVSARYESAVRIQ